VTDTAPDRPPAGPPNEDVAAFVDPGDDGYAAALTRLASLLIDDQHLEVVLGDVLDAVRLALPDLAAASITTIDDDGGYATAAASDARARAVDEVEYAHAEGPCVEALETGEEQLVDDVRGDHRYPAFERAAMASGYGAVAGLPLRANGQTYGALNLYGETPGGIDEQTLALCRQLAAPAGSVLANARAFRASGRLSRQLEDQLAHIAVVHQAVGVLMVDRGCDARAAASLLERTAAATERDLHDVAEQLVRSVSN